MSPRARSPTAARRELPLVADVVDGQNRAGVGEQAVPAVEGPQQQRPEPSMPVMAVKDMGTEAKVLAAFDGDARQRQETQVLVRRARVNGLPTIKRRAVDEVHRGVGAGQYRRADRIVIAVRSNADAQIGKLHHRRDGIKLAIDRGIKRDEQPYLMALPVNGYLVSAAATSASPPVLANGATSEAIAQILIGVFAISTRITVAAHCLSDGARGSCDDSGSSA